MAGINVHAARGPRLLVSALLALAGGWLQSLCFAREPLTWLQAGLLPWVAWTPLVLLLDRRWGGRWGALWGWLCGTVYWLVAIPWIIPTLEVYGGLSHLVSIGLLLLLALYLGVYHALFVALGRSVWHSAGSGPGRGALALAALPALWVALEWVRGWAFGGFPWNLAAYAGVEIPGALPLTAWVGAWGVSYLLLFVNVALARAATRAPSGASERRARQWTLTAAVAVPLLALTSAAFLSSGESADAVQEVRILQPNTGIVETEQQAWESYLDLLGMSDAACDEAVVAAAATAGASAREPLLLWPESAAWPYSYERSPHLRDDLARLNGAGCQVLLGSPYTEDDAGRVRSFNAALLMAGGEPAGSYAKRKLVPWGEYVPLAEAFPFIGKLARNAGDFSAGRSPALLGWGEERLGVAICYEVIFPAAVAEQVRAGATVLVTITNDAWYGDTSAPWQHFRAARFRAAESRRPLLRAALTGVSAVVDRRGAVRSLLDVDEQGVLAGRVAGSRRLTPFSRAPWLVPAASGVLALFAMILAAATVRASASAAPTSTSTALNVKKESDR